MVQSWILFASVAIYQIWHGKTQSKNEIIQGFAAMERERERDCHPAQSDTNHAIVGSPTNDKSRR
jgi:hypothetical protein